MAKEVKDLRAIGAVLTRERKSKKMSINAVAKKSHVSRPTVVDMLRGQGNYGIQNFRKVVRVLGIRIILLTNEDD